MMTLLFVHRQGRGRRSVFPFITKLLDVKDSKHGIGVAEYSRNRENKPMTIAASQLCSFIVDQGHIPLGSLSLKSLLKTAGEGGGGGGNFI